ncbi:hypothetical protein Echvi_2900 [Echinicola vietnamensis DSM 17526]|uniref:Uncharacterized protein n=1 Tax=Echinicola vietnamensis (strain DSM 17526 / LMG 23754 / KMM 6221) TaxID=926556 RepID=L0FYZ9_ECHVK|nr:hypothetical protein Echvi_2900 [Echinicola vietnamensis DSM 17526]
MGLFQILKPKTTIFKRCMQPYLYHIYLKKIDTPYLSQDLPHKIPLFKCRGFMFLFSNFIKP